MLDFEWGSDTAALGRQPDLLTGADVVYEEHCFPALLASIEALSAAHTVTFLAYRMRGALIDDVALLHVLSDLLALLLLKLARYVTSRARREDV